MSFPSATTTTLAPFTSNLASPTFALTTAFTPPPACTPGHFAILENRAYQIWLNEPVPVPGTTLTSCYPPEFISSYISSLSLAAPASALAATSSVDIAVQLPAFSPLVCPKHYSTVLTASNSYAACCPSGFQLAPNPSTTITNRPAFGGTCYSNIQSVLVTQYDNSSAVATSVWSASTSGAQAYAHVIDGYAVNTGSATPLFITSSSSSTDSAVPTTVATMIVTSVVAVTIPSTSSTSTQEGSNLSGGALAGTVIGVLIAVLAFAGIVIWLLRRRSRQNRQRGISIMSDTDAGSTEMTRRVRPPLYEADSSESGRYEKDTHWGSVAERMELPVSEMEAPGSEVRAAELT